MEDGLGIDAILQEENIKKAIDHMKRKKRCGFDGMYATELPAFWEKHSMEIRKRIMEKSYRPRMAVRVPILKPGGGKRFLEIPSVLDRMLEHAVNNILQPYYEKSFHKSSHGFRKGRGTETALAECIQKMNIGKIWIADLDIKGYFDNVSHRRIMNILRESIKDESLLALIESFLRLKVNLGVHIYQKKVGLPQGGPLSPLLANIFLDRFDDYLDSEGFSFVRYADDIIILCTDRSCAEIAMEESAVYLREQMGLNINLNKSGIVAYSELRYLGYSFQMNESGRIVPAVDVKSLQDMEDSVKHRLGKKNAGKEEWWDRLGAYNRGWINYFRNAISGNLDSCVKEMDRMEINGIERILNGDESDAYMDDLCRSVSYVAPWEWFEVTRRKYEEGYYAGSEKSDEEPVSVYVDRS